MRCVRGFVAFLALATVGWLAFVPATTVATNPAPERLITGFSDAPNPDAILYAINKASAADSAPLRKAALAYIGDNDQKTRYAALYALALTAKQDDAEALAKFLTSPIADERLLAAATLAGLRDKRALPVLIATLDQDEPLAYREAGERASTFAQKQLLHFTSQDFGLKAARTPEQIATTKPEWDRWWQKAGDSVHYDPQTRRFVE
jgi:HEAT repeat protein